MKSTLQHGVARAAMYAERFGLSVVFFYLGASQIPQILNARDVQIQTQSDQIFATSHYSALCLLGFLTGALLLFGRRMEAPPQNWRAILTPLLATFFNLTYYLLPWFPTVLMKSLCPPDWQYTAAGFGFACMLIGPLIALWGLTSLGRSFGVFVSVRKVVLSGPYSWIRHPMYLGYTFIYIGLALVNFTGAYWILVTSHIALLLYRAHLEETYLAEHSEEYRERMKKNGFILPRFRQIFPE